MSGEYLKNITLGEHTIIISYSDDRIATTSFLVSSNNGYNPGTGSFLNYKIIVALIMMYIVVIIIKNSFNKLHKI